VKFLLVPLLIIGMFASFIAALLAMLFFTGTVQTPEELQKLITDPPPDSTRVVEQFANRSDELDQLLETANQYNNSYQAELKRTRELQDSLLNEQLKVTSISDSLETKNRILGRDVDSTLKLRQVENLKNLAVLYDKIKAATAAEILQQNTELSDTTVAKLMKQLKPAQMAKIMGNMDPAFAARITKLMQEF
jgi:flagellar motility protein MotE (MotC chaperone)